MPHKPNAPDEHGLPCSVFVAVNFDDPAPLEADVTELPSTWTSRVRDTGLWHGLRLASMRDILHVEVRVQDRMIPSRPSVGRDLVPGGGLPGI